MKSDFLSTVSHELRTPLTAIEGFAETLAERWASLGDGERRHFIDVIARNARDLHRLMEQLLDLSRLDSGWQDVKPRHAPLASEVRTVVAGCEPVVGPGRVVTAIPDELTAEVDPDALRRILGNLLTNAAKFSPASSPIEVSAREDGLDVVVSVRDHGIGVDAEERDRIFDRFYRSSRGNGTSGTGLGLAIAQRYAVLQGGRIWVESTPGRGATFSFTVPRAAVARHPLPRTG